MIDSHVMDEPGMISAIRAGEPAIIRFSVFNDSVQKSIHFLVDEILKKYHREDMTECVYTSVKELVINGVKANIKHAVFRDLEIDPGHEDSLKNGLVRLKSILTRNDAEEMGRIASEHRLQVTLNIIHSQERIILIVENNTTITCDEEKRIREKFAAAMKYESIADYYMDNLDDSEGQGMGITMVVLMLKGNNIDPHAFTINLNGKNATTAKIVFPISQSCAE